MPPSFGQKSTKGGHLLAISHDTSKTKSLSHGASNIFYRQKREHNFMDISIHWCPLKVPFWGLKLGLKMIVFCIF